MTEQKSYRFSPPTKEQNSYSSSEPITASISPVKLDTVTGQLDTVLMPPLGQSQSAGSEVLRKGLKYDEGKIGVHLLPPGALLEIAKVLDFGARKYAAWNWSKGLLYTRLYAALLRHLWAWFRGEDSDPETGLSHLAHAGCCVLFLLHYVSGGDAYSKFDDRPIRELKGESTG